MVSTVTPAALVRPATTGCRGHKDARSLRRPLPAARVVSYYGLSNGQLDGDRVVCRSSDASFVGGATVWMMADKKVTAPSALNVCIVHSPRRRYSSSAHSRVPAQRPRGPTPPRPEPPDSLVSSVITNVHGVPSEIYRSHAYLNVTGV